MDNPSNQHFNSNIHSYGEEAHTLKGMTVFRDTMLGHKKTQNAHTQHTNIKCMILIVSTHFGGTAFDRSVKHRLNWALN